MQKSPKPPIQTEEEFVTLKSYDNMKIKKCGCRQSMYHIMQHSSDLTPYQAFTFKWIKNISQGANI